MIGPTNNGLSIELINAIALAWLLVLPVLIIGFTRHSLRALRIRPVFPLHSFETEELSRAEIIHEKICRRLKQQRDVGERVASLWGALFDRRKHSDETEELEAYAQYLRVTIMRLRRRPLLRLKTWLHIKSSQFAFSQALVIYVAAVSLLIILFHVSEQSAWASDYIPRVYDVFVWYPIDERLFYSNAVAAGFAALAAPVLYLVRWHNLCRQYSVEFCVFKDLAKSEPGEFGDQCGAEEIAQDHPRLEDASVALDDCNWNTVLGLSGSASIAEVRKAYKEIIKQNHPDRVHDMSPAFVLLAELETKKINAAYQQALHSFAVRI